MKSHKAKSAITSKKDAALQRLSMFLPSQKATSAHWSKMQADYMVDAFKSAAKHVPAYRSFLKERGVMAKDIKSVADMKKVPPTSKKNYLRSHPWEDLCMPGSLAGTQLVLTATSGSTGEPFYFPRTDVVEEQSYIYHRTFLKNSGLDPQEPTLVIVAFGMGVWIGGLITYEAFNRISQRDFPLTLLTPGVNKHEIYAALREIGSRYTQVILCGYPPFVKDIIDDGKGNGVDWKQFDMRIVCAAEGFSEDFRDYLVTEAHMTNRYRDIMNIYGSAELGTMATETPLAVLVRELSLKNPVLFSKLFGEATRLPTLAQYIPSFVSFEAVDNRIYCTSGNVLPMIRYEIGDHGGVMTYAELKNICASEGVDLKAEAKKAGITDTVKELPFVYVYERADLSTKLYGAIIYPEHIKHGLIIKSLHKEVTGKFTIATKNDENQDEYLEVNVELQPKVQPSEDLKERVTQAINEALIAKSAEHRNNSLSLGERVIPRVTFWEHNHAEHFPVGAKHRWVKKK